MANDVTQAAADLNKHKGFSSGSIELWGIMAVRPEDVQYEVKGAKAQGDRLEIELDLQGTKAVIAVTGAAGVKAGKGFLSIEKASRIQFEEWDVSSDGNKLAVKHTKIGPSGRDLPKGPALLLGRS